MYRFRVALAAEHDLLLLNFLRGVPRKECLKSLLSYYEGDELSTGRIDSRNSPHFSRALLCHDSVRVRVRTVHRPGNETIENKRMFFPPRFDSYFILPTVDTRGPISYLLRETVPATKNPRTWICVRRSSIEKSLCITGPSPPPATDTDAATPGVDLSPVKESMLSSLVLSALLCGVREPESRRLPGKAPG